VVVPVVTWSAASELIVTDTVVVPVGANWAYMAGHAIRTAAKAITLLIFMAIPKWRLL
jgi:hypothetical protein